MTLTPSLTALAKDNIHFMQSLILVNDTIYNGKLSK